MCEYDIDCPQSEICFGGTSWIGKFIGNDVGDEYSNTTGCLCDTYYSYNRDPITGECSLLSSRSYGLIFTDALYLLLSIIGLIMCIVVAKNMKLFTNIRFNAATTTLMFLFLSYIFAIIQMAADIDSIKTPIPQPAVFCDITDDTSDKCAKNDVVMGIANALMMVFAVLACLNVGLMWIEACSITGAGKRKNVSHYRKPMIIASVIYFIATLVTGPILGKWEYAVFITIPFYVGIASCYSFGYYLMHVMLLEKSSSQSGIPEKVRMRNKQIIATIKKTSRIVVLLSIMLIIDVSGYTYIGYTSWKEISPVGVPSPSAIADYFEPGISLLLNFTVHRYIYLASKPRQETVEDIPTTSTRQMIVLGSNRQVPSGKVQSDTQDQ